jgi:hypothetical protein
MRTNYSDMSTRRKNSAAVIAAIFMTLPLSAAFAQDRPIVVGPMLNSGQLQTLQSRQQRENFQQRQQFNREIDSLAIQRQPRIEVPVIKPRCPLSTSGTPRTC